MNTKFVEVPASKTSITMRKSVYGVGINNADYNVNYIKNGKSITCKYYKTWSGMLERCYSKRKHITSPTYIGCIVCTEWLIFSNFKIWMELQDWENKELDKDILGNGKVYSPETCVFISKRLNTLLNYLPKYRGDYKLGVTLFAATKRFVARCNNGFTLKHLGYFDSEIEAHKAYCDYKATLIREIAEEQSDVRVKNALINRAKLICLVE